MAQVGRKCVGNEIEKSIVNKKQESLNMHLLKSYTYEYMLNGY